MIMLWLLASVDLVRLISPVSFYFLTVATRKQYNKCGLHYIYIGQCRSRIKQENSILRERVCWSKHSEIGFYFAS